MFDFNVKWKDINLYAVLKGCSNSIIETVGLATEKHQRMAQYRTGICESCTLFNNGVCDTQKEGEVVVDFIYKDSLRKKGDLFGGCGCNLKCKIANNEESCPLGKWLPVV